MHWHPEQIGNAAKEAGRYVRGGQSIASAAESDGSVRPVDSNGARRRVNLLQHFDYSLQPVFDLEFDLLGFVVWRDHLHDEVGHDFEKGVFFALTSSQPF